MNNMVDPVGAAAYLRSAAQLVREALERLDVSESGCTSCGSRHFVNRTHAKLFEQFERTAEKLTEAAARLANENADKS